MSSIGTTLAVATALTACGAGSSPRGELAHDKKILATCDRAHAPASWVAIDGTGSSAAPAILAERMKAIEAIARTTAVCSGYLRVTVFSSSTVATTVLMDTPLAQRGATTNSKLLRIPRAVASVMATVRKAYGPAVARLDQRDSDILGQYGNASQFFAQLGGTYQRRIVILTDGMQTTGIKLGGRALSKQKATELAAKTSVPKLLGAAVTVAGLGRVAGSPPRSDVVQGLTWYFNALCRKAGAATCLSVTDYATAGQ
ncbi:MAG TPA: hypothetical protein VFU43_04055 [Streptosporangiaceae bacterium]|nr:hypothetical protein [Streptosporangiaceae bacterium]